MNANNWCCEIIKKTISLFKPGDNFFNKKGYCDINERYFLLYFYWKKIVLDKKTCDSCQKVWQAEKDKLAKEDEGWEKEQDEELKNRKCANCQKGIIVWRYKKFSEEPNAKDNEDSDWENKGVLGRWACQSHDNYYCQDENCTDYQRAFCSLKCLEMSEEEEDKFLEIAALSVDPELESKSYSNIKIGKIPSNILKHFARI